MDKKDLRIVFMGTPEFAVESLKSLVEQGYKVVAVVTQPDKPVGRHHDTFQPSAVKEYALSVGLPVLQPIKMKDAGFIEELKSYKPDIQIVVAFRMLPEVVWDLPRFGTFNVHAALLPQFRGAAPINWAVINGESETGVTTFFLDKDIDTGRIILQKKFPIPETADVEYVYGGLMKLGAEIAIETVGIILDNVKSNTDKDGSFPILKSISREQVAEDKELRQAPKIFKETCEIVWNQKSENIYNFIRGLSPYPGAWSIMEQITEGRTEGSIPLNQMPVMKIFETVKTDKMNTGLPGTFHLEKNRLFVNTQDYLLELKLVQMSGKKRMDVRSFLNGFQSVMNYYLKSK